MIDIEEELEAIIKDNGLQAFDLLKTRLERIIGDILQNAVIKHGRKIIIRGLKPSEKTIHPFVSLVSQYGEIVSIVDRAPSADQIFYGQGKAAPVLGCNDSLLKSKESQCDIYIINSLYNGKNIYYEEKERLLKKGIYVIDLYTEIRRTYSVCLGKEYEYYTVERDFTHNRLQEAISDFRADPNENTLTRLLSICLSMRDFVSFYTYMKEGIKFLGQSAFLVKIHRDINRLLQKIQEEIESRNKLCHSRDIILHWIDQVGYDELRLLPKVSAHIHQGLIFLNSYTVTPYTKPTVRMIFWKDFRIKEKSDENNGGGGVVA
ncbi:MAG: hypothetical protein LIP16_22710 [Clostridium sp.]|nr:hypothetical protein [Clostridium sp.]